MKNENKPATQGFIRKAFLMGEVTTTKAWRWERGRQLPGTGRRLVCLKLGEHRQGGENAMKWGGESGRVQIMKDFAGYSAELGIIL